MPFNVLLFKDQGKSSGGIVMRFNDLMGDGWGAEVVTTPWGKLAPHTYYFSLMAYERFFGDTGKKSCYIDYNLERVD